MGSKEITNCSLFLLASLGMGGSERKIVRIANRLADRGHNVCIAYLNDLDTLRHEISPEIPVVCLDKQGKFSFEAVRRLKEVIVRHSVNRLFSVNLYPILYAALAKSANRDIYYYALINVTTAFGIKEKFKILFYLPFLWFADQYVFGCRYQAQLWNRKYCLSKEKSSFIYNGVDASHFEPNAVPEQSLQLSKKLGISSREPIIGTVGRLRPEKSQHLLIEAAAVLKQDYPNLCVIIVGSGAEEPRLEAYIRELGVRDSVILLGEQLDVRPALSLLDVFVLTSTAVETFSNAALEAMAMAKSLVLSDISGARELIEEGKNGYVVKPGSSIDLAECLAKVLGDQQTLGSMAMESRARIEKMFTIERMVENYEALIVG